MSGIEFKVIPAPDSPRRLKKTKGGQDPYAATLTSVFNEMGQDGWEFIRVETVQYRRRAGLFFRKLTERQMLVFRRSQSLMSVAEATAKKGTIVPQRIAQNQEVVEFVRAGGRKISV